MQKILGNGETGLVFVLSAPAGTGKTTLMHLLKSEFSCVAQSISYTTRKPRENEVSGKHYHFISRQLFEKKIEDDEFLEYVKLYDDYYGTPLAEVKKLQSEGKHVILVIDTQGALQVRNKIAAVTIFVMPPSIEELKRRLYQRDTETSLQMEKRLKWVERELQSKDRYDYLIINDDLTVAYQVLRSILIAEEHRRREELKL